MPIVEHSQVRLDGVLTLRPRQLAHRLEDVKSFFLMEVTTFDFDCGSWWILAGRALLGRAHPSTI